MIFRISCWLGLILFCNGAFGQEGKAILEEHAREFLEPRNSIQILFNSTDFVLVREKKEHSVPVSDERLKELEDSLAATNDESLLLTIGDAYNDRNRYQEGTEYIQRAQAYYQRLFDENDHDTLAVNGLFSCYSELGNQEKVLEINKHSIEIWPESSAAYIVRPLLLIGVGDNQGAVEASEHAIEQFPELTTPYLAKTMALIFPKVDELQNAKDANDLAQRYDGFMIDVSFLKQNAAKYPDNAEIQVGMLCMEFLTFYYSVAMPMAISGRMDSINGFAFDLSEKRMKEVDAYEERFSMYLKHSEFKNPFAIHYSYGLIELLRDNPKKAIGHFEKSLKYKTVEYRDESDNVESVYDNIQVSYAILKQWNKEGTVLERRIKEKASYFPVAANYQALAQHKAFYAKDFKKALSLLNEALALEPTNLLLYKDLAYVHMLLGDYAMAEEALNVIYSVNQNSEDFYKAYLLQRLFVDDKETAQFLLEVLLKNDPESEYAQEIKRDFFTE